MIFKKLYLPCFFWHFKVETRLWRTVAGQIGKRHKTFVSVNLSRLPLSHNQVNCTWVTIYPYSLYCTLYVYSLHKVWAVNNRNKLAGLSSFSIHLAPATPWDRIEFKELLLDYSPHLPLSHLCHILFPFIIPKVSFLSFSVRSDFSTLPILLFLLHLVVLRISSHKQSEFTFEISFRFSSQHRFLVYFC